MSTSYSVASGGVIRAGYTSALSISDSYPRSCVDTALSSVTGTGNSAVINLYPRPQQSEFHSGGTRWVELSAEVSGVLGYAPKFRCYRMYTGSNAGTDWMWASTRRPMYSIDGGYSWAYFDNCTINTGSQYAEFYNNSPFTVNKILVSRSRQITPQRCGEWLDNLAGRFPGIVVPSASAVAYTPTSAVAGFAGQAFIANEYLAQTDEKGRTIPVQPLYAAKITNANLSPVEGGSKRLAMISGGVHAGEDLGDWVMREFVHWLLAGSKNANRILSEFDILMYPLVNAPGRAGGGYRGTWTVYTGGKDDFNRNMNTTGVMEPVDKFKAAITTDRNSVVPKWSIDFHGTGNYRWGFVQDAANSFHTMFNDQQEANFGQIINDEADTLPGHVAGYMSSLGVQMHLTLEVGDISPIPDSEILDWVTALGKTLCYPIDTGMYA